jgi:hypothetical protein
VGYYGRATAPGVVPGGVAGWMGTGGAFTNAEECDSAVGFDALWGGSYGPNFLGRMLLKIGVRVSIENKLHERPRLKVFRIFSGGTI